MPLVILSCAIAHRCILQDWDDINISARSPQDGKTGRNWAGSLLKAVKDYEKTSDRTVCTAVRSCHWSEVRHLRHNIGLTSLLSREDQDRGATILAPQMYSIIVESD